MEKPEHEIENTPLNLKSRFFLIYFRSKPLLKAIAFLGLVAIFYNQYLNHPLKLRNPNPWIVTDVISGDRFLVERSGKKLEVQLCGISASSDESKAYLRSRRDPLRGSLLNKGDGSVILDKVQKKDGLTIAEVFMQIEPDYVQEIHLNTEMVLKGKAILGADYKACPNAEYLEMAVEIEK